jgi:hypothetical protein
LVPEIDGQAAVVVVLQRLVLGAERIAVQRIRVEEVFGVLHGHRPEVLRRRDLPFREGDLVGRLAHERLQLRVVGDPMRAALSAAAGTGQPLSDRFSRWSVNNEAALKFGLPPERPWRGLGLVRRYLLTDPRQLDILQSGPG